MVTREHTEQSPPLEVVGRLVRVVVVAVLVLADKLRLTGGR